MRFGAHVSIAGGVDRAVDRAVEIGCDTLQVFTKNARQWAARPLAEAEVEAFRRKRAEHGLDPAVAHASYLINLASGDDELWERSWKACAEELNRCRILGLDGLVLHPGTHRGDGREVGLQRVARALERVGESLESGESGEPGGTHDGSDGPGETAPPPLVLLECTAGQGTALGGDLRDLRWLLDRLGTDRLGVCLDTCHLHAAGYGLTSPDDCDHTLAEIDRVVGLEHVQVLHCNDSRGEVGSRLDRHAHPGRGTIGVRGFRALLTDPRIRDLAAILETPKDDEGRWDRANLARLRAMHRGDRRLPAPPPAEAPG